jgi:hypothetical protein
MDRKNREVLEPYKARVLAFIGSGPKWVHEMAEYMKSIGMQSVLKGTLNYKKALTIYGLHVDERGHVTVPPHLRPEPASGSGLSEAARAEVPTVASGAAPPAAVFARRRINVKGPHPAIPPAPAVVFRRINVKRAGR